MLRSLLKSSAYSISAAAFSYALILVLARGYSEEAFAHYLYVVTWGLLIVQSVDLAAEQCLVHFSRTSSRPIESVWWTLAIFKLLILGAISAAAFGIGQLGDVKIPYEVLLMIVPAFYMGPLYECHGHNAEYAKLMFFEKLLFLTVAGTITIFNFDIFTVICAYMLISLASLWVQRQTFSIDPDGWSEFFAPDINRYVRTYLPVYLVLMSQLFYGNISRLVIEEKLGAIAFASITIALQIVNAISMIQSQVDRHIRPLVINAIHAHDRIELMIVVKRYSRHYLAPIVMGCILLSALATEIVSLLFGARWSDAGRALSFASPLVFTIACMRFVDILVVALNAGRINLVVNVLAAVLLFGLLWLNPSESLASYVMLIVLCQGAHVAFMSTYLYVRVNRVMCTTG